MASGSVTGSCSILGFSLISTSHHIALTLVIDDQAGVPTTVAHCLSLRGNLIHALKTFVFARTPRSRTLDISMGPATATSLGAPSKSGNPCLVGATVYAAMVRPAGSACRSHRSSYARLHIDPRLTSRSGRRS